MDERGVVVTPENGVSGGDFVSQEKRVVRGGSVGFSPVALRRHLQRAGYTVEEVADQIGLSRQAVSAWLAGRTTPSPQSLSRVAQLLEVTTADLTPGIPLESMTLQDLRTRAGMSQTAVAQELGVLQSYLSDVERGRRELNTDIAAALARLYQVPLDEILDAWERAVTLRKERLAARRKRKR